MLEDKNMKKMMMVVVMVLGCVIGVMGQDDWFEKELKKAQRGNVKSQFYIGTYYEKGEHSCTQDYDKALYWYVECVKNGDYKERYHHAYMGNSGLQEENLAAWAICDCFESWKNRDKLKNPSTAFQMVNDAVKKRGSYILKKLLADWYYDGFGVTEDRVKAFALYKELYPEHQYEVGSYPYSGFKRMVWCYYEGTGTPVDYKKAMMCDRFKDSHVSALSDSKLLNIYTKGDRCDRELNDLLFQYFDARVQFYIRNWIENAARGWGENGIYMNGKYYGRDEKAYANNSSFNAYYCSPYAAYCYGNAYETGRTVPVDIKQAKLYYAFAIKRSSAYEEVNQLAQQALDRLNGIQPQQIVNLPTITIQSPSSSASTSYRLKACIKSNSQISSVKVTANGSVVINNSRGIDPVVNNDCAYFIDQNLTLRSGSNTIVVSVTNAKGTESKTLNVTVSGTPPTPPQPQKTERRIAFVVGNSNYQNAVSLKNPVNDATDIAAKLKEFGFTVILRSNLNRENFDNAISDFGRQAKNYDVALFYYAGHGIQYKSNNYLIPIDARLTEEYKIQYECVNAGIVLSAIENVNKKIVILDACRNNPFSESWHRSLEEYGLAQMNAPDATFIAYSTSPNKTAVDGFGRNSPFTAAFLEVLNVRGLSISDVFMKVNQKVRAATNNRQKPWTSNSFYENFIFNK